MKKLSYWILPTLFLFFILFSNSTQAVVGSTCTSNADCLDTEFCNTVTTNVGCETKLDNNVDCFNQNSYCKTNSCYIHNRKCGISGLKDITLGDDHFCCVSSPAKDPDGFPEAEDLVDAQCLQNACSEITETSFANTCEAYNLDACTTKAACQAADRIWTIVGSRCVTSTFCSTVGIPIDTNYGKLCVGKSMPQCTTTIFPCVDYTKTNEEDCNTVTGARWDDGKIPGYAFCMVSKSCTADTSCQTDEYCNTAADPDTCSAKQADGASCTRPTQCSGNVCSGGHCASSCMFDNNCTSFQFCDTSAIPKACTAKKANNAPCSSANQCTGKFCNNGKCASSPAVVCDPACDPLQKYCNTLASPPVCEEKKVNGTACTASNQCDSGYCSVNKCAPAPALCTPACSATEYCVGTTCKPKQLEGQVCTNSIECTTNLCHLGACMTACADDTGCIVATQFCNTAASPNTCNTKKSDTQPCTATNQCTGGFCNDSKCASSATPPACSGCTANQYCAGTTCTGKKDDGETCSDPSQCTGGACNNLLCASVATAASCPAYTNESDCAAQSLTCEWVSNACSSKPGLGQACTFNMTDGSENCRTGEGSCITYEGVFLCRKTCTGTDCPAGNFCFDAGGGAKFCKTLQGDGGPCTDGTACVSGVCEASKCKGGAAPAGTGVEGGGTPVASSGYPIPNFLGVDDPNLVVGRIIKYIVGFVGTIALVTFMYGGALWLISAGRMDYVTKGKNYMIWAAIGLAVVFGSYILVGQIFTLFGQ